MIAVSVCEDHVATVFEAATEVLLFAEGGKAPPSREPVGRCAEDGLVVAGRLRSLGVRVLLCGAVSRAVERVLAGQGIVVHAFLRGSTSEVWQAYLHGDLGRSCYHLPGRHGGRENPLPCCGAAWGGSSSEPCRGRRRRANHHQKREEMNS